MEHIKGCIWGDRDQKVASVSVYCLEGLRLCTNTFHLTAWSGALQRTRHTHAARIHTSLPTTGAHTPKPFPCTHASSFTQCYVVGRRKETSFSPVFFPSVFVSAGAPWRSATVYKTLPVTLRHGFCYQFFFFFFLLLRKYRAVAPLQHRWLTDKWSCYWGWEFKGQAGSGLHPQWQFRHVFDGLA